MKTINLQDTEKITTKEADKIIDTHKFKGALLVFENKMVTTLLTLSSKRSNYKTLPIKRGS